MTDFELRDEVIEDFIESAGKNISKAMLSIYI